MRGTTASDAVPAAEQADAQADAPPSATKAKKRAPKLPPPSVDLSDVALKSKADRIVHQLSHLYPDPPIPLTHGSTFQLLVAVVLSAQTTDLKVNEVTPGLFEQYPDARTLSCAEVGNVAHHVRFLGLGPTKAKNIVALSKMLVDFHGGEVPGSWEALEALPGVGHKTASVVMSQAFGQPAFPVDTHIHRLSQRWGLTTGDSVEQTESDLKALMHPNTWRHAHLQIIYFGREHCPAQGHDPTACPICSWAAVAPYNRPGASPARAGQKPTKNSQKPSKDEAVSKAPRGKSKAGASSPGQHEPGSPAPRQQVTPRGKAVTPRGKRGARTDSPVREDDVTPGGGDVTPGVGGDLTPVAGVQGQKRRRKGSLAFDKPESPAVSSLPPADIIMGTGVDGNGAVPGRALGDAMQPPSQASQAPQPPATKGKGRGRKNSAAEAEALPHNGHVLPGAEAGVDTSAGGNVAPAATQATAASLTRFALRRKSRA